MQRRTYRAFVVFFHHRGMYNVETEMLVLADDREHALVVAARLTTKDRQWRGEPLVAREVRANERISLAGGWRPSSSDMKMVTRALGKLPRTEREAA